MNNEKINPYEIMKDSIFKILSLKHQNIIFLLLFFTYVFKKFFQTEFVIIQSYIINLIPNYIKSNLELLAIPVVDFLFMIGFLGILCMILMIIVFALNEKKGWFEAIVSNYLYYFRGNNKGIFDNIAYNIIFKPTNIGIIILIIAYLFGSSSINKYLENYSVIFLAPYFVLSIYIIRLISMLIIKAENDY